MSGSSGSNKSSTTFQLAPEQKEMLGLAMPFLRDFADDPAQAPSGTAIAPFNRTQQIAQQNTLDLIQPLRDYSQDVMGGSSALASGDVLRSTPYAKEMGQVASGAYGASNPTFDSLEPFTSGQFLDMENNPTLQGAIKAATRPVVSSTMRTALPNIRSEFVGAGGYGGSRQGIAEGLALSEMQRNIGDISSDMSHRAYETGIDATLRAAGLQDAAFGRQLDSMLDAQGLRNESYGNELDAMVKAQGLAPQTAGLRVLPTQLQSAVGDARHGMEMAQAQEAYQQNQLGEMWNLLLGQELAGTVGMIPGGTNISKTPAPEMNPFSALLGGLGLFGGMGSMLGFL